MRPQRAAASASSADKDEDDEPQKPVEIMDPPPWFWPSEDKAAEPKGKAAKARCGILRTAWGGAPLLTSLARARAFRFT